MAIVKQLDKRSGITYVYESTSYWDREKQQPRSKRTLIGRFDPETGKVVPTDGRGKRRSQTNPDNPAKRGPVPIIHPLFPEGKTIIHQTLVTDPDTGMYVQRSVYEAGVCPPKHKHNCGHGMYVLSGTLKTDMGLYGPGSMVWWPAGIWMVHGATDEEDVEVLFITNKPFDIEFEDPSFLDV